MKEKSIEYFMNSASVCNNKTIIFNIDKNEFVTGNFEFDKKIINKKWEWKDSYKLLRYDYNTKLFLYYTEDNLNCVSNHYRDREFYKNVENFYGLEKYINSFIKINSIDIPLLIEPSGIITFKVNRVIIDSDNIFISTIDKIYNWNYNLKLYDWLNKKSYLEFIKPEQNSGFEYYLVGFRYFNDALINNLDNISYNYVADIEIFLRKYISSYKLSTIDIISDYIILWLLIPKQVFESSNGLIAYEESKNILVPNIKLFEHE